MNFLNQFPDENIYKYEFLSLTYVLAKVKSVIQHCCLRLMAMVRNVYKIRKCNDDAEPLKQVAKFLQAREGYTMSATKNCDNC